MEKDRPSPLKHALLARTELEKLTRFREVFSLQSAGFTVDQAKQLVFLKWLYRQGRLK